MIDLHSHILPELDDGARSLRDSLDMARLAVGSGVTIMVATPHCVDDRALEVYQTWKLLRQALRENDIPLRLFWGMEIFGTPDTARLLQEGKLLTLNGSRYPLIEFPFRSDGAEETRILRSVSRLGLRPVVAHPERYSCVQNDPELINRWHRMGCLFQINRQPAGTLRPPRPGDSLGAGGAGLCRRGGQRCPFRDHADSLDGGYPGGAEPGDLPGLCPDTAP